MPSILISRLLARPGLTGAIAPSSAMLGQAMAEAAAGAGHIVELGAGTGPVTRQLARRHPGVPLTVVELHTGLARRLAGAHPAARVLARPAAEVLDELAPAEGPVALVSSLPFRSLPPAVHQATRTSIVNFLERCPNSWLVQFTYQPRAPFHAPPGWVWRHVRTVFANLPPAGLWTLKPGAATAERDPNAPTAERGPEAPRACN